MSMNNMEYFKFQDPSNTKEHHKESLLEKFLLLFIPRGNPDFDKIMHTVASWYIEYDTEGDYPNREVGFDSENKPIMAMPTDRNYGYWTDNNLKLEDFLNSFNPESITKQEFEDAWNSIEV